MQVNELYWFLKKIIEIPSFPKYVAFINQLRTTISQYKNSRAVATPNANQLAQISTFKTNIVTLRNQAIQELEQVRDSLILNELMNDFDKYKIENIYTEHSYRWLTLIPNEIDIIDDEIISESTSYHQKLNSFQQLFNSLRTIVHSIPEQEPSNQLIIRFEGDAVVQNLKELAVVSKDWNQIVNCFGRLTRENDTNISILVIEKGSLIATLLVSPIIIGGLIRASSKILDLILKIYEVRKKALELKQMKFDGIVKAIEILEKQSTINASNEARVISKHLLQEYGWTEGDSLNETESAVTKAVKKLIKFQNDGGKVEAKLLSPSINVKEDLKALNIKNTELKNIEEELKLLSGGKQVLKLEEGDILDDEE